MCKNFLAYFKNIQNINLLFFYQLKIKINEKYVTYNIY